MSAHYWVIANEDLMDMLRRVEAGESPDIVAAECYANSDSEQVDP